MKQVILFSQADVEAMHAKVHDSLVYIKSKPMLSYDDCLVLHKLEEVFEILTKEEE